MNATVEYLQEALMVVTDKLQHRDSAITDLSEQVKVLTKERDALYDQIHGVMGRKFYEDMSYELQRERDAAIDKCDKLEDHIVELTSEEHSIPELRNQLQNEFEEKRKCYFAISQLQKATNNLIKERDDLKAAGKLSLYALENHSGNYKLNPAECAVHQQAITALRQAGVQ